MFNKWLVYDGQLLTCMNSMPSPISVFELSVCSVYSVVGVVPGWLKSKAVTTEHTEYTEVVKGPEVF